MTETLLLTKIRTSEVQSSYLEAALFTSASFEEISQLLEIPTDVIEAYVDEYLPAAKGTKLEKLEVVELQMSANSTRRAGTLKLWAMANGLEFLRWRLGLPVKIAPVDGVQDLFSTCMYKAKEAMFVSSTSDAGRESQKWVKLATDLARLSKVWVTDSKAARQDLEIALREIVPDFESIADLGDFSELG